MRAALLALAVAGCQGPDRWSVTGGSTLGAGLDSAYHGERDFESQYLELGVSGPLGFSQERGRLRTDPCPDPTPSAPTGPPIESGGVPWAELLILASGAAAMKGGEYGYRKVRSRRGG